MDSKILNRLCLSKKAVRVPTLSDLRVLTSLSFGIGNNAERRRVDRSGGEPAHRREEQEDKYWPERNADVKNFASSSSLGEGYDALPCAEP